MRTIARLSVAPVKSLRLLHPDRVRLERSGVPENRRFYLAEPDGTLFTAAKFGPVVAIVPEYDAASERLRLRFPDGAIVEGDVSRGGRDVTTDFFGRAVHGRMLEGPWAEAFSSYVGQALRLVRVDANGDGNDDAPVSLFSTASAEELARRSGRPEALDSRRFRMLVEVAGCEPHEEDRWNGTAVRLGEAVVKVVGFVGRCVITTQSPSTGHKDLDTLKAIKAYRGMQRKSIRFGVYADVLEPGTIGVGDPVVPQ